MIGTHGGPEVLEWCQVEEPEPGPADLLVDLHAAGVNFIDTYHRGGLYPVSLPLVPGVEGSGVVTEVGSDAKGWSTGDRVAWTSVMGSYSEKVVVPSKSALRVPDQIDLDIAAAVLLQGLTAHYLTTSTFPLQPGHRCLIHAGAGGVGLLLIQVAKKFGAEVFTTVGSAVKAELATAAGADHVILYRSRDFVTDITERVGQRPLDVVFDGVGASVFERSLHLLGPRGMMVTFGNASGPVPPVSPLTLMGNGSLFLTRPTLGDYINPRQELDRRAQELFSWLDEGLSVRIDSTMPLASAAEAHQKLEARETSGKLILKP